jgi:hypothetical protein
MQSCRQRCFYFKLLATKRFFIEGVLGQKYLHLFYAINLSKREPSHICLD